jgi:hypothetical protein
MVGMRTVSDGSLTGESDFVLRVLLPSTGACMLEHVRRQTKMIMTQMGFICLLLVSN